MSKQYAPLVIIDGNNLIFRMFYGIPNNIKNKNGEEIKAVVGFTGSLLKLIKLFNSERIIIVFDGEEGSNKRKELLSDYKADRIAFDEVNNDEINPFCQLGKIKKVLDYIGITYIEKENEEAGDVIASICNQNKNDEKTIVSTDKDFFQLINDTTKVYYPRGKLRVLYDLEKFKERYDILPIQFIYYKALVGDPSDNIKGIKGIGKKTAVKILKEGSIEKYTASNEKTSKLIDVETIKLYRKVIKLNSNINLQYKIVNLNEKILNMKTMEILNNAGV